VIFDVIQFFFVKKVLESKYSNYFRGYIEK